MRLQEMTAKRIELLGKLESARMQESVNKAMDQLTATVGDDAPTLKEVEDKIQQRAAMASAKAELRDATPEGAMVELEHEVNLAEADRTLDELRAEMGLGAAPTVGTPEVAQTPPAGEIASPPRRAGRGRGAVGARDGARRDARGAGRGAEAAAVELGASPGAGRVQRRPWTPGRSAADACGPAAFGRRERPPSYGPAPAPASPGCLSRCGAGWAPRRRIGDRAHLIGCISWP